MGSENTEINEQSTENLLRDEMDCQHSCLRNCKKLSSFDWLKEISAIKEFNEIVEVQFKNTRKAFFHNSNGLRLDQNDIVAVEASPGHDIGRVSLTGHLVLSKLIVQGINYKEQELKKIYRKAKQADIDKWKEAIALEESTML